MWRTWEGESERWLSTTAADRPADRIIDCLAYFGRRPKGGPSITPGELRRGLEQCGVERCAALSLRGVYYDFREGNLETLKASRDDSFIIPAATLDPRRFYGKADEELGLSNYRIMRVFPEVQGWPVDFAPFEKILQRAAAAGLPVMAPAQGLGNATKLVRSAEKLGLTTVLTTVNYSNLSEVLALLSDNDGLIVCIDMLNTPDGIELITDEFGPERLVFGSNFPDTYFHGPLIAVQRAEISSIAKGKILRENAARLLGIE
ncbi:MAG: amidohydrolase family protein [Theionarchaea archaeon]|nr:amidohydrolase family protein [Theionarchaea archaeon]